MAAWGAHIGATGCWEAYFHGTVVATPAKVTVATSLQAVTAPAAVVEVPHAQQQAWVLTHVHVIGADHRSYTHAS